MCGEMRTNLLLTANGFLLKILLIDASAQVVNCNHRSKNHTAFFTCFGFVFVAANWVRDGNGMAMRGGVSGN